MISFKFDLVLTLAVFVLLIFLILNSICYYSFQIYELLINLIYKYSSKFFLCKKIMIPIIVIPIVLAGILLVTYFHDKSTNEILTS